MRLPISNLNHIYHRFRDTVTKTEEIAVSLEPRGDALKTAAWDFNLLSTN